MRLPSIITDWLCERVWEVMRSRPADILIGKDEHGFPYLERWFAIPRNRFFNCYLHLYHHDDAAELHSHPWWSVSLCVRGALHEIYARTGAIANQPEMFKVRNVRTGDIVCRSADMFHRLEVTAPRTITVFFTGPKIKTWYFACKRGLVEWSKYVTTRDPYGHVGSGCGEDDEYPFA